MPWKIALWNDTFGHDFEILRPCCSMSDLTLTLRHDTGNRRLDYAICHAVIEPAYKF